MTDNVISPVFSEIDKVNSDKADFDEVDFVALAAGKAACNKLMIDADDSFLRAPKQSFQKYFEQLERLSNPLGSVPFVESKAVRLVELGGALWRDGLADDNADIAAAFAEQLRGCMNIAAKAFGDTMTIRHDSGVSCESRTLCAWMSILEGPTATNLHHFADNLDRESTNPEFVLNCLAIHAAMNDTTGQIFNWPGMVNETPRVLPEAVRKVYRQVLKPMAQTALLDTGATVGRSTLKLVP